MELKLIGARDRALAKFREDPERVLGIDVALPHDGLYIGPVRGRNSNLEERPKGLRTVLTFLVWELEHRREIGLLELI
jgi:hypothetical protein